MSPATKQLAILVWLILGCALLAANMMIDPSRMAETSSDDHGVGLQSTAIALERAERVAFINAWQRWETGEHAVSGVLTRRSGDEETEIRYREARLDGRSIHQIGPSVVLVDDQGRRVCHQDSTGRFLCTTMAEGDGDGDETESTGTEFGTENTGPVDTGTEFTAVEYGARDYTVSALDHVTVMLEVVGAEPVRPGRCWEARVKPNTDPDAASVDPRWGVRSWFCFDTETAALMLRHAIMDGWTETAVARIVSGEVTDVDLAPSPTLAFDGTVTRG